MEDKKKLLIFYSICLIVVLIIGLSFAYFIASITGLETNSTIVLNGGTMDISYEDNSSAIFLSGITPKNTPVYSKNFILTGDNTTQNKKMPYTLMISIDSNDFTNKALSYTLESENTSNNGKIVSNISNTSILSSDTDIILGSGFFNPGEGSVHTYSLKFYFLDTGVDQSENMGKNFSAHIALVSEQLLVSKLNIGDFVLYDAGSWSQSEIDSLNVGPTADIVPVNDSTSKPITAYQFGGFVEGQSRNIGVVETNSNYIYAKMYDDGDSSNKVALSGWRIFDIDEMNDTVTLISAANPEDYYFDADYSYESEYVLTGKKNSNWSGRSTAEENFVKRDFSMYENPFYNATNARVLTYDELNEWYSKYIDTTIGLYGDSSIFNMIYNDSYLKYQNLIDNHSFYWVSASGSSSYYEVNPYSQIVGNETNNQALGIRILVTLPLSSFSSYDTNHTRTVTLDGLVNNISGTYGSNTVQTYNVWELDKEDTVKVLQVGDFVDYDAGTWTQAEIDEIDYDISYSILPDAGYSRNNGYAEMDSFAPAYYAKMYDNGNVLKLDNISGWRIFDIDDDAGVVTLISAANPEDFYIGSQSSYMTEYILSGNINPNWSEKDSADDRYIKRDWSMYENSDWGSYNANVLTYNDLVNWYRKYITPNAVLYKHKEIFQMIYSEPYKRYQNLIDNHTYYWLIVGDFDNSCFYISPMLRLVDYFSVTDGGIRVLISIPLSSFDDIFKKGVRTVTYEGLYCEANYCGLDSRINYNIWALE